MTNSDLNTPEPSLGELALEDRSALRRVAGLSTELTDVSEVEYRQLRLERVVLVGCGPKAAPLTPRRAWLNWPHWPRPPARRSRRRHPASRQTGSATYIGSGKAAEVRQVVVATGADTVICDGELSPAQLNALEKVVKVKVIDRTALILDIFAQHATSREGKAQVCWPRCNTCCPGCAAGASRCPDRRAAAPAAAVAGRHPWPRRDQDRDRPPSHP